MMKRSKCGDTIISTFMRLNIFKVITQKTFSKNANVPSKPNTLSQQLTELNQAKQQQPMCIGTNNVLPYKDI
ncbi:hypothetical protein DERP_011304 [Dermatophagoides pteronyssinus]|uniref:Uncharacterized protein n=1 Tax=Dermatophagoides pteronyssinus TaxID=6956 RepID=A0ABQ8J7B9_DERPT|nr:hypothetical protein DERP_011304 [Dermatophagoides pteronyssinus]